MESNKKNFAIFGSVGAVAVIGILILIVNLEIPSSDDGLEPFILDKEIFTEGQQSKFFEATDQLKKISSESELREFLAEAELVSRTEREFYDFARHGFVLRMDEQASTSMKFPRPAMPESMELATRSTGSVSLDSAWSLGEEYSTTNVQVENVDEPDFLKNDGKYLYILSRDKLTIIDAYPADQANIILKIGLDIGQQDLQNMFLNEDRLIIFYNDEEKVYSIPEYEFVPDTRYKPKTHAITLDVSDRNNPKILKDYDVDGHYHDARMIGDYVYFVSNSWIDYRHPIMPLVRESSTVLIEPEIFYFDNPESDYNFNTITAFDVFGDSINSETFLMGDSDTIFVSEDSIYITYRKNIPHYYFETLKKDRFFDVIVPLLPERVQQQIKSIEQDPALDWYQKWEKVSDLLLNTFNQMPDDQREKLFEQIQKDLEEYDSKLLKSSTKTVIHKISIDDDKLEYLDKAEVPGYLLNQFSMDESDDRFRIATTSQYSGRFTSFTHNNVYVLDDNLNLVGSLEKIAPDETIFSARFMGDRLYLVTFERIDPFFVIDLSSDTPKILGELKIPGFSNYLHPYDEDHIIGIGRDTEETKGGGVRTLGLKVALFDVSDFHNPKTVDTVIIGDQNTDSEVLNNHKAFLFDLEKDILSFPVRDHEEKYVVDELTDERHRHSQNWLGFYVYGIEKDKGFDLKGTIEHYSGNGYDYRFSGMNRSFYIEDVIYTVSSELVKMNDLNKIDNQINEIALREGAQVVKYLS